MVAWTPPASLCKRIESAVNHLVMTLMPLSMPVEARCPMNCGINSWEEATSTFDGGGFSSPTVRETSITKIHFRTTILTTTDTSGLGDLTNNKVSVVTDPELKNQVIHNGCGGTRIAYGNSILLQTTSLVISAIKRVFSSGFDRNFLITFRENSIVEDFDSFYERGCTCCNEN